MASKKGSSWSSISVTHELPASNLLPAPSGSKWTTDSVQIASKKKMGDGGSLHQNYGRLVLKGSGFGLAAGSAEATCSRDG